MSRSFAAEIGVARACVSTSAPGPLIPPELLQLLELLNSFLSASAQVDTIRAGGKHVGS